MELHVTRSSAAVIRQPISGRRRVVVVFLSNIRHQGGGVKPVCLCDGAVGFTTTTRGPVEPPDQIQKAQLSLLGLVKELFGTKRPVGAAEK